MCSSDVFMKTVSRNIFTLFSFFFVSTYNLQLFDHDKNIKKIPMLFSRKKNHFAAPQKTSRRK